MAFGGTPVFLPESLFAPANILAAEPAFGSEMRAIPFGAVVRRGVPVENAERKIDPAHGSSFPYWRPLDPNLYRPTFAL